MIILDTMVISAVMASDPLVVAWMDRLHARSVYTTSVSLFEVRFGLAIMPDGARRQQLEVLFEVMVTGELGERILDFDATAARGAAHLAARRQRAGRSIEIRDTMIAGIAQATGATIATRNARHFQDAGLQVVNPWVADGQGRSDE